MTLKNTETGMPFRRYPLNIWSLACLALTLYGSTVGAQDGEAIAIEAGKTVSIDYTLSLVGAEVLESNLEDQPLIYTQGNGEILNALETELLGLVAGDEKLVTLAPEDAYGTIDPTAFQEVPIEQVPEEARKVDTLLNAPGYQGTIRVAEVQEEIVILDFNHPLAGKALTFDITIVSVE
jgi:FKBP-type peptidyl-prolyl cis-trans isomerase 2